MKLAAKKFRSFLIACFVVCFAFVAFFGVHSRWGDVITSHFKGWTDIPFGLEFNAHNELLLEPTDKKISVKDPKILRTLNKRLNAVGITDREILVNEQDNHIILKYSQPASNPSLDAKAVCRLVGQIGELNLQITNEENSKDNDYNQINIISKNDLKNAEIITRQYTRNSKPEVGIKLNFKKSSFKKLADLTNELVELNKQIQAQNSKSAKNDKNAKKSSKKLLISVDGIDLKSDNISAPITDGQLEIFNNFNMYMATMITNLLNSDDLPTYLELLQITRSAPKLGSWLKRCLALTSIATLLIVIAVFMFKFGLVGTICSICLAGHLGFIMAGFTGFFKIYPGVIFNLAALTGCLVVVLTGIASYFLVATKIKNHSKNNPNGLFSLSIKNGLESSLPLINSINFKFAFSSVVLMTLFGTETNVIIFLLKPIFNILGFMPLYSANIASFAYALFVGSLGALIFENMILKSILDPVTSSRIRLPKLDFKKLTNLKKISFKLKKDKPKINKPKINRSKINKSKINKAKMNEPVKSEIDEKNKPNDGENSKEDL